MSSLPGITRQDEEKRLQHTLEIAQRKVDANRQSVQALAEELHAMQEEFDENDKEAQALWHNADQVRESGSAPGGTGEEKALLWQNRFPGQKTEKRRGLLYRQKCHCG